VRQPGHAARVSPRAARGRSYEAGLHRELEEKGVGRGRLRLVPDLVGDKVPDVAAVIRQTSLATGEASCYWPLLDQTKEGP